MLVIKTAPTMGLKHGLGFLYPKINGTFRGLAATANGRQGSFSF